MKTSCVFKNGEYLNIQIFYLQKNFEKNLFVKILFILPLLIFYYVCLMYCIPVYLIRTIKYLYTLTFVEIAYFDFILFCCTYVHLCVIISYFYSLFINNDYYLGQVNIEKIGFNCNISWVIFLGYIGQFKYLCKCAIQNFFN